jgi:histidine triad (HIT) family protein
VHEPTGYVCPFCRLLHGVDTERNRGDDIVWQDESTTALISPKWWSRNPGHAIVIPNAHVENLYEIDEELLGRVYGTVRRVAGALKETYDCSGTSTRQHNEPDGNQDVWHLHVHVFPRYAGDELYERHTEIRWATPAERAPFAARLRGARALQRAER